MYGKLVATWILKLAFLLSTLLIRSKNMKRLATPLHVSPVTASNATTKGKASVYLSVGFFFFLKKNTSGSISRWVINELSPHQRKK